MPFQHTIVLHLQTMCALLHTQEIAYLTIFTIRFFIIWHLQQYYYLNKPNYNVHPFVLFSAQKLINRSIEIISKLTSRVHT